MLDILALSLVGCLLGIITGLTPGLHVNTIAALGLASMPLFPLSPLQFAACMVSMATVHSFIDFIPSIFLGAPEEETALGVLPAHRLLLQGKALDAVKLTCIGSVLGMLGSILLFVPALLLTPLVYPTLLNRMGLILCALILVLFIKEGSVRGVLWAVAVFCLSGYLGLCALNLKSLSSNEALFPVFSGLFGLSALLHSIRQSPAKVPQRPFSLVKLDRSQIIPAARGSLAGFLIGVLPAISPSQLGGLLSGKQRNEDASFLVTVSSINTADALFSFVTLYTIKNPRSGVATLVGSLLDVGYHELLFLGGVTCFTAALASFFHMKLGKIALQIFCRIDCTKLNCFAIGLLVSLVYLLTGAFGLFLCFLSASIGLLPIYAKVSRTHCMGILIVPTIAYFLGL